MEKKHLSVVIPIFNEAENILPLYNAVTAVLSKQPYSYEIIFIDDSSTDLSRTVITDCCNNGQFCSYIFLKRNYGQTAAIAAGLDYAKGEFIVTIDGDLQNDPSDIPLLYNKIIEGYDLVNGWRKERKDPLFSVILPSKIANILIKKITGVQIHDTGCSLKIFRRELLDDLHLYGEMHRFIPALVHWSGAKITEIEVSHSARKHGNSKYSINKLPRVILDLINVKFLMSYSTRPIQIFGKFAIYSFTLSFLAFFALIGMKYFWQTDMTGNPFLLLTVFLAFVGVQFITMGLLGEINIRIYHETTKKTIYHIAKTSLKE